MYPYGKRLHELRIVIFHFSFALICERIVVTWTTLFIECWNNCRRVLNAENEEQVQRTVLQ